MFIGDVVNKKTGGCLMTVDAINHGRVTCVWFDDKGKLRHGEFAAGELNLWKAVDL